MTAGFQSGSGFPGRAGGVADQEFFGNKYAAGFLLGIAAQADDQVNGFGGDAV